MTIRLSFVGEVTAERTLVIYGELPDVFDLSTRSGEFKFLKESLIR